MVPGKCHSLMLTRRRNWTIKGILILSKFRTGENIFFKLLYFSNLDAKFLFQILGLKEMTVVIFLI